MNSKELDMWKNGVDEHLQLVKQVVDERIALKTHMEEHLRGFFDGFVEIDFSQNLDVISLKWAYETSPIIKNDIIGNLGMDWEITTDYNDDAFKVVVIRIYPFGIPMEEDSGD